MDYRLVKRNDSFLFFFTFLVLHKNKSKLKGTKKIAYIRRKL